MKHPSGEADAGDVTSQAKAGAGASISPELGFG